MSLVDEEPLPSVHCPSCLGDTFKVLVRLGDSGAICWYTLQGHCYSCEAPVKLPVPKDEGDEHLFD